MISGDEVRRIAGSLGVAPQVVDHDYALGCFLRFLGQIEDVQKGWVFKGGTALAKCYFEDYRFSEDLDFTITDPLSDEGLRDILQKTKGQLQNELGIRTDERDVLIDVIEDEYSRESLEGRVYYRGPWAYGGDPRSIRMHVNRDELIAFPPVRRPIVHRYSDKESLATITIAVYTLEEVFVEKLRAFAGQRRRAISRDIYDLFFLGTQNVQTDLALSAFSDKCRVKDLDPDSLRLDAIIDRREEYRSNWENQLVHLLPQDLRVPFDQAWDNAISILNGVIRQ